jgi:uncharacterized protein YcaQ
MSKGPQLETVNRFVLHKQHLTPESKTNDLVQITGDIVGLHATSSTTPYLSLFARASSFAKHHLEHHLYERRTLGKIRCVRKTIYIHPADMLPIVFGATWHSVEKASRRYAEGRGISPEVYDKVSRAILAMLEEQEKTAPTIKADLGTLAEGLDISALLYLMCDQGLLIRGRPAQGWRDKTHRYAPFCAYFPDIDLHRHSEAEAIVLLAKQYLTAFGPATEADLVWWMGLGKTKARRAVEALEEEVIRVSFPGLPPASIMLRSDHMLLERQEFAPASVVNLLPPLDPYLMGYKERARYLSPGHAYHIFDRAGNATSTILVDGRVVGVWDFAEDDPPELRFLLLETIKDDLLEQVCAEAQRLGEFLADGRVVVRHCDAMVPLTERTMGSFLSPLKGCQSHRDRIV